MTNSVREAIETVVAHLVRLNRPVVNLLQPGLSPSEVLEGLQANGLGAHRDLVELYTSRNGARVNPGDMLDDLHFFPGFYWLPLSEALASYRAFRGDARWHSSWLPVFANGGGDFYAVICDPSSSAFGQVVGFILGEPEHPVEFLSIRAMLRAIRLCYAEGVYFVRDGYLEADDARATAIARAQA